MSGELAQKMSEKQLQAAVLECAGYYRWRCYHTFDSRRSQAGFPDLCMVRCGRLVFAELKSERGKLTNDQRSWIVELVRADVETYLWRPSDWTDGTIEAVLKGEK